MTMPSELPEAFSQAVDNARSKWGWFIALGVLLLIFGGVAFANLLVATVASVYFVGSLMLIGGVLQIFHAFGVKSWGSFFWWVLGGILYAVAGVLAFSNPLLASAVLTFLLAVSLIANGVLRVWTGLKVKPASGWGWLVAAGVITALAGLIIAMGWPVNSLWILGLFLAIDLIFQGWAFIAFGLALKAKG